MNISSGRGLITLREHILLCGIPAGSSMEVALPKEVPSARSLPVSVSGSLGAPDDDANAEGGDADSANDDGGVEQASRKWNLAAVLGGDDKSTETCISKWLWKAKK